MCSGDWLEIAIRRHWIRFLGHQPANEAFIPAGSISWYALASGRDSRFTTESIIGCGTIYSFSNWKKDICNLSRFATIYSSIDRFHSDLQCARIPDSAPAVELCWGAHLSLPAVQPLAVTWQGQMAACRSSGTVKPLLLKLYIFVVDKHVAVVPAMLCWRRGPLKRLCSPLQNTQILSSL